MTLTEYLARLLYSASVLNRLLYSVSVFKVEVGLH